MKKRLSHSLIAVASPFLLLVPLIAAKHQLTEIAINGPFQLAFDSRDNLYVVEHYGHRILRIDGKLDSVTVVAGNGKECCFREGASARSNSIYDVDSLTLDDKDNIYVGGLNARDGAFVRKIDGLTGRMSTVAGDPSAATQITPNGVPLVQADVREPKGLVVTKSGSLVVSINMSYQLAELARNAKTIAGGTARKGFSGDGGLAIYATFDLPGSIARDAEGNLFVADYYNHRIRRIAANTQIVTTVAGNGAARSFGDDGPATEAGVQYPFGIAVDAEDNLYIIENGTGTIRRVESKTGIIKTIAGTGHMGFCGDDGLATQAEIAPVGIAVDTKGNLFVTDMQNNRIRKIDRKSGIISTVAGNGLPKRKIIIE